MSQIYTKPAPKAQFDPASGTKHTTSKEWLNKTRTMKQLIQQNCPDVINRGKFKFYAPSFAGTGNSLNMTTQYSMDGGPWRGP